MFSGNTRTKTTLQPKTTTKTGGCNSPHCTNDVFIFSPQTHHDASSSYHFEYDYSNNVLNTIFGYNSKAQNWFNGILKCLKPFWSIIGPKETQETMYDEWEIPFEMLKDLQWLGSGAQGAVFMGKCTFDVLCVRCVQ